MSKKIKYIVAAVLAGGGCVAVIFTINRKKSGINMNVGELSGDEQNYWNPDIHSISKAENGYYYLHYDGKDLLVKYFDESQKGLFRYVRKQSAVIIQKRVMLGWIPMNI